MLMVPEAMKSDWKEQLSLTVSLKLEFCFKKPGEPSDHDKWLGPTS